MLGPETVDALEQVTQPTIAKIRGHCFTGGLELALACDFLVTAESTKFGDTHGQWGLVPIWGMSIRLPERVGLSNAKDMMFTARRIDGDAAQAIGLVDRVVPDDELDAAVDTLAAEICANSAGHEPHRQAAAARADGPQPPRRPALRALQPARRPRGHGRAHGPAPQGLSDRDGARRPRPSADDGGDRAAAEVVQRVERLALQAQELAERLGGLARLAVAAAVDHRARRAPASR